jgi:hypothetical protein
MTLAIIHELGVELERQWAGFDFDLAAFPGICAERLESSKVHARVDPDQIVGAVFRAELPAQFDPAGRFGQPPVTLFRTSRFFIDALFWVDGTTTIHDHSFSGAFQVLTGQSIETTFAFSMLRDFDGSVRIGDLSGGRSELRSAGDVRAVPAGAGYIHSLFHLARPSVTLVVRTFRDPTPGRQFAYSPAGIAFDTQTEDQARDRIVQTVEMLRRTEHPEFESRVGGLIAESNPHTAFSIVRALVKNGDSAALDRLMARIRDPEIGRRAREWVVQRRRIEFLISRRNLVQKPSLRFLLAILLNARHRDDALALTSRYAPDVRPAGQLAAWLRELAGITMRLQVGGGPFEPNVIGLPPFGPGCEEGLADFLAGETTSRTGDVDAFIERLRVLPALEPLFSGDGSGR